MALEDRMDPAAKARNTAAAEAMAYQRRMKKPPTVLDAVEDPEIIKPVEEEPAPQAEAPDWKKDVFGESI